jgi:hypothetical protein
LEAELEDDLLPDKKTRKEQLDKNVEALKMYEEKKWYVNNGKKHVLMFQDDEIERLRGIFNGLDKDGGGSIGIQELKAPLLGLGLTDTYE